MEETLGVWEEAITSLAAESGGEGQRYRANRKSGKSVPRCSSALQHGAGPGCRSIPHFTLRKFYEMGFLLSHFSLENTEGNA